MFEPNKIFPVFTGWSRWLLLGLILGLANLSGAEEYEKAGEGEGLLSPAHKGKDPAVLESAIRNSGTPAGLALAAMGNWIRYQKSLEDADLEPLTELVTERGYLDEVALMLAFHDRIRDEKFTTLFHRLASHSDPEVQHLAAATLSTVHLFNFISNSESYDSPHLDQLQIIKAANEKEEVFPGQSGDMNKSPLNRRWNRAAKNLPAIPDAWFSNTDRTLVSLAMVAAAFDGGPQYADAMLRLDGGLGTAAGARLLYLCRQETPPETEGITRMFTDAFRSPPAPMVITRPSDIPETVKIYSAEVSGAVLACMALGQLGDPAYLPLLLKALDAGDMPVKMEALRALRRMEADDSVQIAFARLVSEAPGMLLPDLCASIATHPDERLLPLLLLRLRDETGRFRQDLAWALAVLAGGIQGETPEEWIDWWRKNRETFTLNPEASETFRVSRAPQTIPMPANGRFYGMSIYSDHVVFVVDTSKSMRGTRIDSLRENLVRSLESFEFYLTRRGASHGSMWYNIIDFGGDVISMEPGRLMNDIKDGIERAETMPMTFGTRSFDAIWQASRLSGMDTIYFLSDGAPVWGQVENWSQIQSALMMMYWHRPIAVWSVAFEAGKSNANHMRGLSYSNFGLFQEI